LTDNPLPSLAKVLKLKLLEIVTKSNELNALPLRINDLKLKVLPIVTNDMTDKEEPNLAPLRNDMELPQDT
jgi:hypothetical protein